MKEIATGVFVETAYPLMTVGAIQSDEGWVCIDTPPYPQDAQAWQAALQDISNQPVRFVINTDHHRDRILSNGRFSDATVVAHEATSRVLLELGNTFVSQAAEDLSADDNELVAIASSELTPPAVSFNEKLSLMVGEREIELISQPSAAWGSLWVGMPEESFLFVGDTVVTERAPYIHDGLSKTWLNTLRVLRQDKYADWTIISGRDGIIDPTDSEQLSEYLRVARRRVTSLLRADKPRSEVSQHVEEMLTLYPVPAGRHEQVQQRVKSGLERIYDELRAIEEAEADEEAA